MAPNLQKFCRSVAAAKLLSPAELEKHYRSWRSNAPEQRDNLTSFVKSLVQAGRVTEEQIARFLKEANAVADLPKSSPIDVELIAVRDPNRKLDRRDALLAVAGAAIATAIVMPIMWLTRPTISK